MCLECWNVQVCQMCQILQGCQIVPSAHPPESSPGSGYRSCQPRLLPLTGAHYCHFHFHFTFHQQLCLPLKGAHYCHFHFHYHFHLPSTTSLTSHRSTLLSLSPSINNLSYPWQEHIIVRFYQHSSNITGAYNFHYNTATSTTPLTSQRSTLLAP